MGKAWLHIDVANLHSQEFRKYNEFTALDTILFLKNDLQLQTRYKTTEYKDTSKITTSLHIDFAIDWYVKVTNPRLGNHGRPRIKYQFTESVIETWWFQLEQVINHEEKQRLLFDHSQWQQTN